MYVEKSRENSLPLAAVVALSWLMTEFVECLLAAAVVAAVAVPIRCQSNSSAADLRSD